MISGQTLGVQFLNMRTYRTLVFVVLTGLLLAPIIVRAQDEARAAWLITNFDITVSNLGSDRALNARAVISARNVGHASGSTLSLRLNTKAEIKSVSVGNSSASYQSRPEPRANAQRFTINLPSGVAPNETVMATVEYRLPVAENSGLNAISPVGSQFLPQSLWYPVVNNSLAVRGADYAPFRLTLNGVGAISSGVEKSANGNSVFEQSLNAQPFFVAGTWDRIEGGSTARGINAFLPKGAGTDEQKQAESLIALANNARSFYGGLLGAAPDVPVRLIAVTRGGGFDDGGGVLLGEGAFRRKKIDTATALNIAESMARLWMGADTPIRGEGNGVLREGLVRFLACLFIEKEFGAEAADAERARQRLAYSAIAKRDGPLSHMTAGDNTYFNSAANKGAMVWRLVDHVIGHETFISTLRASLQTAKADPDGLTLTGFRTALAARGGASLKGLLDQQLDQATDMDLLVGLPHQEGGQWVAALRNLGSAEANVSVVATSDTGQQVTSPATIPAHDFGQATFKSTGKLVRVEVDPEKLYPQLDYSNDMAPHQSDVAASLAEATRLFGAQDYAKAEALARDLLSASPRFQEMRIVFARTLLAENKTDDAEREFKQLASERLPIPAALAWASIGLGEIAVRRGQTAEATRDFTDAVRADAEYASTITARAARIRAESTGGTPPVDESAKTFIGQFDSAVRTGRQSEVVPLIVPGELSGFIRGVVSTQPEAWQTRVLRSDQVDANRLALDVAISSKQLGVEHSATAVFILTRVSGAWKLNAIEFLEEK
jgi:tetratricopeptide (TPR) repeat protein